MSEFRPTIYNLTHRETGQGVPQDRRALLDIGSGRERGSIVDQPGCPTGR